MLIRKVLLSAVAVFCLMLPARAQSAGEVMFVGFSADGNDGISFVALVNLANGTTIHFNDNEWNELPIGGGGGFNAGETAMTWQNNTGSAISAGTVITVNTVNSTPAPSVGIITTGTLAIATVNEVVYMFLGVDNATPSSFLSAIGNNGFSLANGSLVNTGLTAGTNATSITGNMDIMVYINNVNCNTTVANCAAVIATAANWATEDGGANEATNGVFPDFPANVCDVAGTLFFPQTTYYSLATGAWDLNTSWSLTADGSSGAVAAGVWPRRTDNVVIRSGHTITINAVNDNKSCGNSPNGLGRSNVSPFTGSADLMFYHTGDILVANGGTLSVSEEIMLEGYTLVEDGGTFTINEDIINLGYLEVSVTATFNNTDDLILSGNSTTIIDNTSVGSDDIYMDWTNATLCGRGVMSIGNGGADPTIQYFNGATNAQICSSFTVTCSINCGVAPFNGTVTGSFISGYTGPAGVGDLTSNRIWLMSSMGTFSDAGITPAVNLGTVRQWNDQSGNGNNASQATAGNRPIYRTGQDNGLPALEFTGNLFIDGPVLGVPGTGSFTYVVVYRDTQTGLGTMGNGAGHYILDRPTATNELVSLKPVTGSFYGFQKRDNAGAGLGGPISTTSINTNAKWVELVRNRGTNYRFYYNGVQESFVADADGNLTPPRPRIGRHATAVNGGLRGFFHEFIVYSRLLNNAQRIIINNYVSAKYGLALSVDDFYTMDTPANGNYDFEAAGIGQASDGSNEKDAQGIGVVRMWNPNGLANGEFMMWGHDNTAITSTTTASPADVDGTIIQERLSRIWRVGETGDVGTVSISFDFSGVGGTPLGSNLRLLIDRNGNGFGDNDVTPIVGTVSNGIAVFSNVNFQNGDRFTLGNTDASSSLPVELVNFTAKRVTDWVVLSWSTASELNNDFFTVERSGNAEKWEDVAQVPGAGTTYEARQYQVLDDQPLLGISYYRLKQTDFDGQFEYSNIVSVNYDGSSTPQVSPNPSTGRYTLNGTNYTSAQLRVTNSHGQPIRADITYSDGNTLLDISPSPAGVYILQLSDGISLRSLRLVKL